MIIPVGTDVKGKEIKINYETKKLQVIVRGQTIIDGEFPHQINADTFMWVLEETKDGKIINITFDKLERQKWWDQAIKGDGLAIDCTKISPEPSKLSDLDGEMRGEVEKMMFDNRQKEMGLPVSDDLQKYEMMKKFMEKHPEMDFSQVGNNKGPGARPPNFFNK